MDSPAHSTPPDNGFRLVAESLSKAFGRRRICTDISLDLTTGDRLAVVGPNGSGKSTFLKMLCGLLRPDRGMITYYDHDKRADRNIWHQYVGLVAPDLALYDELSALENLQFINRVGGWGNTEEVLISLLADTGLAGREHDLLGTFSSGMKQRAKYAAALLKSPPLLLLDEPTANLDEAGVAIFHNVIEQQQSRGICVIATNDPREAERAERQIVMGQ